jgi:hypothetical protein
MGEVKNEISFLVAADETRLLAREERNGRTWRAQAAFES